MSSSDCAAIPVGSLVEINGLTSEVGKTLNGGQGFVMQKPEAINGNLRYPVQVYALLSAEGNLEKVKGLATSKSIKVDNLTVLENQKQELFKEAAHEQMGLLVRAYDHNASLPWYATFVKIWPDGDGDYGLVLHYANLLHVIGKKSQQALDILLKISETIPNDFPRYNEFLCVYVDICCGADSHLEQALEKALLVPTDTEEHKNLALRALYNLLGHVSMKNGEDPKRTKPEMFELQLRTAKCVYEVDPILTNLYNIGAAYCLKGENFEGAKYYRRVLDDTSGESLAIPRIELERTLSLAQLQCPGMPLEGFILLSSNSTHYTLVHKSDKDKCTIGRRMLNAFQADTVLHVDNEEKEDVPIITFAIPESPNDPEVFPREFLDSLKEYI